MIFVGWFLHGAAAHGEQLGLWNLLAGHIVRDVMMANCCVCRLAVDVLVEVRSNGRRCSPVLEDGELRGLLTPHRIRAVSRERGPVIRVG